jgi:hypothetical protein
MRLLDGILILFILLPAGFLFWSGNTSPQHGSHTERLAHVEGKLADELQYKFLPKSPGSYEILAIGYFKIIKDFSAKNVTDNLISFANVSVTRNTELVATAPDDLNLLSDTELRRIKIIDFEVKAEAEYSVSLKLNGTAINGIDIVVMSDPHQYKDDLITALLLKILAYVLLLVAIVLVARRIILAVRK